MPSLDAICAAERPALTSDNILNTPVLEVREAAPTPGELLILLNPIIYRLNETGTRRAANLLESMLAHYRAQGMQGDYFYKMLASREISLRAETAFRYAQKVTARLKDMASKLYVDGGTLENVEAMNAKTHLVNALLDYLEHPKAADADHLDTVTDRVCDTLEDCGLYPDCGE